MDTKMEQMKVSVDDTHKIAGRCDTNVEQHHHGTFYHPDYEEFAAQLPSCVLKEIERRLLTTLVRGVKVVDLPQGLKTKHIAIEELFKAEIRRYKRHLVKKKERRRQKRMQKEEAVVVENAVSDVQTIDEPSNDVAVNSLCSTTIVPESCVELNAEVDNGVAPIENLSIVEHLQILAKERALLKAEFLRVAEDHLRKVRNIYEARIARLCTDCVRVETTSENSPFDMLVSYSKRYLLDLQPHEKEHEFVNRVLNHARHCVRFCVAFCTSSGAIVLSESNVFEKFEHRERKLRTALRNQPGYETAFDTGHMRLRYLALVKQKCDQFESREECSTILQEVKNIPVALYYSDVEAPHKHIAALGEQLFNKV